MRSNTGESLGKVGGRRLSTITFVILLDLLHEMNWLGRYVEKQGPSTHRSKRVCLSWDWFGTTAILTHVPIWSLWDVFPIDALLVIASYMRVLKYEPRDTWVSDDK